MGCKYVILIGRAGKTTILHLMCNFNTVRHATGALGVTKVNFEDIVVNFWHGAQGNKQ